MATRYSLVVVNILVSSFIFPSLSNAQAPPKPVAFTFPIKKDTSANQYYTTIQFGSNSTTLNVVIDLGGKFLFFNSPHYFSAASGFRPILCDTPQCTTAGGSGCILCISDPPVPNCTNNTCADDALNPFTGAGGYGGLGVDALRVRSTDDNGAAESHRVDKFPFQYSDPDLNLGLSNSTAGLIGLGRTKISLPAQLVSTFKIRHKLALCLPSSARSVGNMIIGSGSYGGRFREISRSLFVTKLIRNRVSTWRTQMIGNFTVEYFIQVKSIRVGSKKLSLNTTLLSIDKATGGGGTSIRTVRAYTGLHSSILKALVKEFVKAAKAEKIRRVASVAPFGACFDSRTVENSTTGPRVPTIDFVLHGKSVLWRFYGANSMVRVSKDVICLAFVDVGINTLGPSTAIVVGGHQMENHLLEFDVAASKLSFSSSLLKLGTSCSEFRAS